MVNGRHPSHSSTTLSQSLEHILTGDLVIPRRRGMESNDDAIVGLSTSALKRQLVYTVFDGDQELLCGTMRHAIMKKGMVPVNPPSVVGYRDTVVRNRTKAHVLIEDVALLNKCDQIWIFSDVEDAVTNELPIPEGVLFELLFARLFRPDIAVFTVSTAQLLSGEVSPVPFSLDKIETLSDRTSIEEVTATVMASYERIPTIRYYYYDPLDFKYAEWLRACNEPLGVSPLDPILAVRLLDGQQPIGVVAECWLAMLRLADEICYVSSLHEQEGSSLWCDLVARVSRSFFELPGHELSWSDLNVPKALLGSKWPVTSREAHIVSSRQRTIKLCA